MHIEEGGEKDERLLIPDDDDLGYCNVTLYIDGKEVFREDIEGEFGWSDGEFEDIAWGMYFDSLTEEEFDIIEKNCRELRAKVDCWEWDPE